MFANRFALVLIFTGMAAGQSQDRTFYLTRPTSNADLQRLVTSIRTVVAIDDVKADEEHNAILTSKATVDQVMATDWILQQLEQTKPPAAAGYRLAGNEGDLVRVFQLNPASTTADVTGMVTSIRTIVDAQRLFPFDSQKAIIARATPAKIAAAEWLIGESTKPATETVTKSPDYEWTDERGKELIKVIHLRKGCSNANLTSLITAIRTVADIPQLFPMESTCAVIMRGYPDRVATAEWLIDDLTNGVTAGATHETKMPGLTDGVVHVFFLANRNSNADLTSLVTQLRSTTAVERLFPLSSQAAIVLRGRADQVSLARSVVTDFDKVGQ